MMVSFVEVETVAIQLLVLRMQLFTNNQAQPAAAGGALTGIVIR
jgi:hypothetical protein